MADQNSKLDVRNHLIYVGYFFYGYDMVRLADAFGVTKQMIFKILSEISSPSELKQLQEKQ